MASLILPPSVKSAADLLSDFDKLMEESMRPIPTGIKELDRVLNGGVRDILVTLVGKGGSGKTMLAINLARAIAQQRQLLYLSFEMTPRMLLTRFISSCSARGGLEEAIAEAELYPTARTEDQERRLAAAKRSFSEIAHNVLIIDQTTALDTHSKPFTIDSLRSMVARARKETGVAPAVFIGYVQQFIEGADQRTTTTDHLDHLARHLAAMAHGEETPVIAISSAAKDGSIRGSSHLAHAADVILSLELEGPCAPESPSTLLGRIEKNRCGSAGDSVEMRCLPSCHFIW